MQDTKLSPAVLIGIIAVVVIVIGAIGMKVLGGRSRGAQPSEAESLQHVPNAGKMTEAAKSKSQQAPLGYPMMRPGGRMPGR